jgi:hypothetical protein
MCEKTVSLFPIHKIVQPKLQRMYLRVVGDNSVSFISALVRLNSEISVKVLEAAHGRMIVVVVCVISDHTVDAGLAFYNCKGFREMRTAMQFGFPTEKRFCCDVCVRETGLVCPLRIFSCRIPTSYGKKSEFTLSSYQMPSYDGTCLAQ